MIREFEYKYIDVEGQETLEVLSEADRLNEWMYDTIVPYCNGAILEIGSGTGNISQEFLRNGHTISLSDIRPSYCDVLREKFSKYSNLQAIVDLDLVDSDFDNRYASLIGKFDTVFALNVIEHIADDAVAVANCRKLLKQGGALIILVPAFQSLYNSFDEELYHYRRYVKRTLVGLFEANGFRIKNAFYMNMFGIPGWFLFGGILKRRLIPRSSVKVYNSLLPVMKILDLIFFRKIGLSVVAIGEKQ